jgi:signal transduction histidine kinase
MAVVMRYSQKVISNMASIARRVYRTSFLLSSVAIIVMVVAVMLVNEDLEQTMLKVDFVSHRDFLLGQNAADEALHWHTANLTAIYLPKNELSNAVLPPMFVGLPANYAGEWEEGGKEYLINVEGTDAGRLYMARDLTTFEAREELFVWVLTAIGGIILAFNFLLAVISSRRLVRPLVTLSDRIRATPVGPKMPQLTLDLQDDELVAIAHTFNQFLTELERYVKREYSLINLASHELRTPISVILGAAEVLESRHSLVKKDAETLARIKRAAEEMQINITTMLKLARREENTLVSSTIALPALLEAVIEELAQTYPVYQRVELTRVLEETVFSDPVLVKILIRNVLQNALQHTNQEILIEVANGRFTVSDNGQGLSAAQQAKLNGEINFDAQRPLSGLGLYIVTLICEKLRWSLSVYTNEKGGTTIEIGYT